MHLISLKGVCKRYKNKNVLDDINLDFDIGEFVVILGKSGSGKSTLLNIIDYSLKPSKGRVLFQGKKLFKKEINAIKQTYIKKIYQNHNLIPYYTVYENLYLSKVITNGCEEEIESFVQYFNLQDLLDKYPDELSGGERQRVSIIRALLDSPSIILADEPTGSLDKKNRELVLELLKKNKEGKLIVLVTHNQEIANKYADRIITINEEGKVIDSKKEDKETEFVFPINKAKDISFKKMFKLNLKTILKRKSKVISIFALVLLMSLTMSIFFGFKKGVNNHVSSLVDNRLDKNVYHIYYESNEGIKENKDIFDNTKFTYFKDFSYYTLLNNYLYSYFFIEEETIDFYYEISLIDNKELEDNFIANTLFLDKVKECKSIHFIYEDFSQEFLLKEVVEETNIYNNPRIYLSYSFVKKLEIMNKLKEECIEYNSSTNYIYDYYFLDGNGVYEYLMDNKKCVSFYKSVLSKEKEFYVYNNSRIMIKETFQELFDNMILLIEMLGTILFVLLAFLLLLILRYVFSFRKQELGLVIDLGGNSNSIAKIVLSDLSVISLVSFAMSFLITLIVSIFLKSSLGYEILSIGINNTLTVYGIVILIEIIVAFLYLKELFKQDLSLILKEERE